MRFNKLYEKGLSYLNSLTNFENHKRFPKYNTRNYHLDDFSRLLNDIGSPNDNYPIIHIAGSKGKGSTALMLERVLSVSGYRVGLYTSPHLRSVRERISISGEIISQEEFGELALKLKEVAPERPKNYRTYFEIVTAMAFMHFDRSNVDIAVIEAGLGGTLDATNVVSPILTVITSLELEHTDVLGDTIISIAENKAGIIKSGVPCVTASQEEEAREVIANRAKTLNAPLFVVGEDCTGEFDGNTLTYYAPEDILPGINLPVSAPVLRGNATLAVLALKKLPGFNIKNDDIIAGLASMRLPARCQLIEGRPPILLDTAHTTEGVINLLDVVRKVSASRKVLICGLSDGKNISEFAGLTGPEFDVVIAVAADVQRSVPSDELVNYFDGLCPVLENANTVAEGIVMGKDMAGLDGLVVIAGSFYVAGEVLTEIFGPLD